MPEDFVCHPVADAGEELLHEEEGFEGGAGAPSTNFAEIGCGEFGGVDGGRELGPPGRGPRGEGKADAAKKPRIAKDEGVAGGAKNEMIVGARLMGRGGGKETTGHAKVKAEPGIGAEAKEHLFAVGVGGAEGTTAYFTSKKGGGGFPKDTFFRVEMNGGNFLSKTRIPFFTKVFHFSEFGHKGETLAGSGGEASRGLI